MNTIPLTPTYDINYLTFLLILVGGLFVLKSRLDIKQLQKKMEDTHLQISGAGHDLKNKLTTIQLYIQIMQKDYPDFAHKLLLEIENMTEIIENLTLEVVLEDKKIKFKKEKFDLIQFLTSIIDIKRNLYSDHEITFPTNIKIAPIVADKIALDRIIQNLIQNAVKYSPAKTKISVNVKKFNHSYRISIKDQGQGIAESEEKRVFKAYQQIGKNQGMGLGLYIVKTLVEEHNGKIYFESEVGEGTTFYVELPKNGGEK